MSKKKKLGIQINVDALNTPKPESPTIALGSQLAQIEISKKYKLDIKDQDLKNLQELGSGNGGTVHQVLHIPSNKIMARKIIHVEASPAVRKQIMRELQILHKCNFKNIVEFNGAFMNDGDISICMEFMEFGALDTLLKKTGPFPENIIGKVAWSVLEGLNYLYKNHEIIHRDIKPSNILINSQGEVKIADFGVSGQLTNSVANTFVGTSAYMSPERIQGSTYSVRSDVWSLGITLMELAIGRFPLVPEGRSVTPFELLEIIVNEPIPPLPEGTFSKEFENYLEFSLTKNPQKRPTLEDLLTHPFIETAKKDDADIIQWIESIDEAVAPLPLQFQSSGALDSKRLSLIAEKKKMNRISGRLRP